MIDLDSAGVFKPMLLGERHVQRKLLVPMQFEWKNAFAGTNNKKDTHTQALLPDCSQHVAC